MSNQRSSSGANGWERDIPSIRTRTVAELVEVTDPNRP